MYRALFACLLIATTCAAETVTIPVKWVRVAGPVQSEVRNGVCVLYAPDDGRGRIPPIADALSDCVRAGGMAQTAPEGGILLDWTEVETMEELWAAHERSAGMVVQAVVINGFYKAHLGRRCTVYTRQPSTSLGHELKHCFDGSFHAGGL